MKTIEKVKLFIDYKELSYTKFDRIIGAGVGYIGKQIKNNASIGSDVVEKIISNFPELNPLYLFSDDAEMIKTDNFLAYTPERDIQFSIQNSAQHAQTPNLKQAGSTKYNAKSDPPSDPPSAENSPFNRQLSPNSSDQLTTDILTRMAVLEARINDIYTLLSKQK